ncbi:hypothetical protein YTPLAS18_16850 [Nitrospira sp.]|nr:hypothetical protein YTPLAS18_16850 [Nitrospira sp.]
MTPLYTRTMTVLLASALSLQLSATGCSRWMEVKAGEITTDAPSASAGFTTLERVPAVVTGIAVSQNGSAMPPAVELERRVLDTLAETHLFSRLVYPEYGATDPLDQHVRAKLSVALFPEPHSGAAAWKGIVIGASMFLLTPVLPLEYEYGARMTLDLEHEDGRTHRYTATAEGIAHYHLFGATHLAVDELEAKILDTCLTQLQRELVKDRHFVQAGYLAKRNTEPKESGEFTAIPTASPSPRQTRTISIIRSPAP